MKYRKLGRTDIEVSTVAMGCWAIIGDQTWGEQNEDDALAAIRASLDIGINFFDTAEGYGGGESEQLLAKGLGDRRDEAIIATKVSPNHLTPDELRAACERSLTNLATDRIDLYQIHWPNHDVPIDETLRTLEALRDAGKIRSIGVSNFGGQDLGDLLAAGRCESNQLIYSLLTRAIEYDIQPTCAQHDVGILCYSPMAQGLLTGKFATADDVPDGRARTRHFASTRPQAGHGQPGCEAETFNAIARIRQIRDELGQPMADVALAWCLHQPAVTSVLAGARSVAQVTQNAAAADLSLSSDVLAALDEATSPVKDALGPNPDLWQPANRSRMR